MQSNRIAGIAIRIFCARLASAFCTSRCRYSVGSSGITTAKKTPVCTSPPTNTASTALSSENSIPKPPSHSLPMNTSSNPKEQRWLLRNLGKTPKRLANKKHLQPHYGLKMFFVFELLYYELNRFDLLSIYPNEYVR